MIKFTGLDDKLEAVNVEDENAVKDMPTYREVIRLYSNCKARNSDEARRMVRVMTKFRAKDTDVELDDHELKLLKDFADINSPNLTAFIQGQILNRLDSLKG